MGERRTKIYLVEAEGRDKGKRFLITEMPGSQAESWGIRLLLAVMGSNQNLPDGFEQTGMAGVAQLGIRGLAGLPWHLAEPLLKEMFACFAVLPDLKKPNFSRPLEPIETGDYDIEEWTTRVALRFEWFKLHVDFSTAALQSLFGGVLAKAAAAKQSRTATASAK
jgi:hypothetical protein